MGSLYKCGAEVAARMVAEVVEGVAAGRGEVTAASKGIIWGRVRVNERGDRGGVAVVIVTIVVTTRTARFTGKSRGHLCEVVGSQGALEAGGTTGRWLPFIDPG